MFQERYLKNKLWIAFCFVTFGTGLPLLLSSCRSEQSSDFKQLVLPSHEKPTNIESSRSSETLPIPKRVDSCADLQTDTNLPTLGGNPQIQIWERRQNGDLLGSNQLKGNLLSHLCRNDFEEDSEQEVGGTHSKSILQFPHHLKAIFKPEPSGWPSMAEFEIGSYVVDQLFGFDVVPLTFGRTINGQYGSLQVWIHNAEIGTYSFMGLPVEPDERRRALDDMALYPKIRNIRILDYLTANIDRRAENWLLLPTTKDAIGIDNGWAFTSEPIGQIADIVPLLEQEPELRNRILSTTDEEISSSLRMFLSEVQLEKLNTRLQTLRRLISANN